MNSWCHAIQSKAGSSISASESSSSIIGGGIDTFSSSESSSSETGSFWELALEERFWDELDELMPNKGQILLLMVCPFCPHFEHAVTFLFRLLFCWLPHPIGYFCMSVEKWVQHDQFLFLLKFNFSYTSSTIFNSIGSGIMKIFWSAFF